MTNLSTVIDICHMSTTQLPAGLGAGTILQASLETHSAKPIRSILLATALITLNCFDASNSLSTRDSTIISQKVTQVPLWVVPQVEGTVHQSGWVREPAVAGWVN